MNAKQLLNELLFLESEGVDLLSLELVLVETKPALHGETYEETREISFQSIEKRQLKFW